MPIPRKSTKARLIEAALDLFTERGVTETTTKAVAERAKVNEVTLFRNFGNKYRLLLAVIEDSAVFAKLVHALVEKANSQDGVAGFLKQYAQESLNTLDKAPDLVRSIVGEAGNYPIENRLALGKGLSEANRYVSGYLEKAIAKQGLTSNLTSEQNVNLVNFMLMGYFVMQYSCEGFNNLWEDQDDFLNSVVDLFLQGSFPEDSFTRKDLDLAIAPEIEIADLPVNLVRSLFMKAKKMGKQEYAFVYTLFAAGLSLEEILDLKRSHLIIDQPHHILCVYGTTTRQVILNQWVMGFRYGSKSANPLTQWLKSRQDEESSLFTDKASNAITLVELQDLWQEITSELITPQGDHPRIEQARQTWCIEMLMRGIELEDLSILSGLKIKQLEAYAQRAKNKAALEVAARLDQKRKE